MKIIVLGSGIIGTTSAFYLARQGHQVTVIDRQAGAGLETSFANAGQIAPGYAAPWAAPGSPRFRWIVWSLRIWLAVVTSDTAARDSPPSVSRASARKAR